MNVAATAENKPAWYPDQRGSTISPIGTHEDQGGVQVFIVFLQEFLVVLLGHLSIVLVEFSLKVFLDGRYVLFLATRGLGETIAEDEMNLPIHLGSGCFFPIPILLLLFFEVLAGTESQICGLALTKKLGRTPVICESSNAPST